MRIVYTKHIYNPAFIMFGKKKPEDARSRYNDPTGDLPNRELDIALWYIRHKILLQKIGVAMLASLAVVTFGYGLIGWGYYLIFGYFEDKNMQAYQRASFADVRPIQATYAPKDLTLGNTEVFAGAPGKYDFIARAQNPNNRYIAKITYQFVFDNGETLVGEDVILPSADRPMAFFGHKADDFPSGARLVVKNVSWQRVNPHNIFNPEQYIATRMRFATKNFSFIRGGDGKDASAHQIAFDAVNESAYSYWRPVLYIELLDAAGMTTGISYVELPRFLAGETRRVEITSVAPGLFASDIRAWPILDIFDRDIYIQPGQ